MENLEHLKFREEEGVAIITLDRPKVNGLTPQAVAELRKTVHYCRYADSIRCIVITAAGRMFSAGADINVMIEAKDKIDIMTRKMAEVLHESLSIIMRMEKPVITAVNGFAAGRGLGLSLSGDIVIAGESAKFTFAYTNSGLTPDGGSTYIIPRLIGVRRTVELAFMNRTLSAREALEWNMVSQVVPDDRLMDTALELAKKLAKGPTDAYGYIKKLMMMTHTNTLEEQTDFEKEGIANQLSSYNGQEGVKAFMEKRKPNFT
ncbi:MAG: enoyl-CoA hydratase-related protein [Bacteroidota bacterium]